MSGRKMSDHAVADLIRRKCILEVERDTALNALAGLLSHMELLDHGHDTRQTALICGVAVDDREFEAALRHAQLVLRDEADAATARVQLTDAEAKALQ